MATDPGDAWRRLHPVTILRELVGAAWSVVVPVVVLGSLQGGTTARLELLVPVALCAMALGRYLSTRYQVTPDAVLWQRGILFRRRLEVPRSRIQNVAVGTDVLGRVFAVRTVTISSAGSEGEIELALVSGQEASFLLRDLLGEDGAARRPPRDHLDGAPPPPSPPSASELLPGPPTVAGAAPPRPAGPPAARRLVSLSVGQLVLYSLTGPVLALAAVVGIGSLVASIVSGSPRPGLVTLFLIATPVLSTLDLFDFELTSEPDRVRVRSGLLRIRDRWARRERIQVLLVSRPLVRSVLGYESISVATADPTIRRDADLDLCAPLARTGSWPTLAADLVEAPALTEADLQPVSPRAVRRRLVRLLVRSALPVLVLGAAVAGSAGWRWGAAALAATSAVVVLGAVLLARRAQRLDGVALDDTHLLVRRGMVGSRLWLVRRAKVQSVVVSATPFQRRLGLASLHVDTANVSGGAVVVPDLPRDRAEALAASLVERANRVVLPDGV